MLGRKKLQDWLFLGAWFCPVLIGGCTTGDVSQTRRIKTLFSSEAEVEKTVALASS